MSDTQEQALVIVKRAPFNAETPPAALSELYTPIESFYVRSNFAVPAIATDSWRLMVGGAVAQPLEISYADLLNAPARTLSTTMECAGNHRLGLAPLPQGEPWGGGAVSSGEWQGVPLRWLLEQADLQASAAEILFEGADSGAVGSNGDIVPFARSLPVARALDPDTMLAYQLNGVPLPAAHGGPVRLLVPDWYGMASVKWLVRITAIEQPFAGYYQHERYVYDRPSQPVQPVQQMQVKSIITSPALGATLAPGPQLVSGLAWSGSGPIAAVEVSVDGAGAWQSATLVGAATPHTWQAWQFTTPELRPGRHALRCRATDAAGNTQPDLPPWNRLGYGNNAVQLVVVEVGEG